MWFTFNNKNQRIIKANPKEKLFITINWNTNILAYRRKQNSGSTGFLCNQWNLLNLQRHTIKLTIHLWPFPNNSNIKNIERCITVLATNLIPNSKKCGKNPLKNTSLISETEHLSMGALRGVLGGGASLQGLWRTCIGRFWNRASLSIGAPLGTLGILLFRGFERKVRFSLPVGFVHLGIGVFCKKRLWKRAIIFTVFRCWTGK